MITVNELLTGIHAMKEYFESPAANVKVPPEPIVHPEKVVTPNISLPLQLDRTPVPELIVSVTSE